MQVGSICACCANSNHATLTLPSHFYFNARIAPESSAPFRWLSLSGANIFMGGVVVGLPITIVPGGGGGPGSVIWQVTPAGHVGAVGSEDFASGGLLYGGQVDNSVSLYLGRGWSVTM